VKVDGVVYRLALIGYSRKSIRQYYARRLQPDSLLIGEIVDYINGLPASRTNWHTLVDMSNGRFSGGLYPRVGDKELRFYADRCHMNCFRYLSAWIHYASKLIHHFSLSYEDTIGLVIGMYCDNNAIDFVSVATDLLNEDDSVTDSSQALGLSVRQRMVEKKAFHKNKFGVDFKYPQRFRNPWNKGWLAQMTDKSAFREQQATVAQECRRVMEKFPQVTHREMRLDICMKLNKFLANNIYGAGELVAKHLVPIMSVLGLLPSWMSTTSFVNHQSRNYEKFSERTTEPKSDYGDTTERYNTIFPSENLRNCMGGYTKSRQLYL
jgi:hypothetical protein